MKSTINCFIALLCLLGSMGCTKSGQSPAPAKSTDTTSTTNNTMKALPAVDDQVTALMSTYNVPALSIAITQGERLVYAKAYGMADKEANQAAKTTDLYRLASCSKQFTSAAIMVLLDQKKIDLSSTVFGSGGILGTKYGTKAYGPHITDITVDELLHHTAGGWGNSANDPMFLNPTMTADQLITWTLDNMPLKNTPARVTITLISDTVSLDV
ncbi:MAG: beta-lactamase family protein [Bacteroidetes bacterium]|nr:beta-lactamase family protein [Bacteroidota bacterium]